MLPSSGKINDRATSFIPNNCLSDISRKSKRLIKRKGSVNSEPKGLDEVAPRSEDETSH